MTDFLFDLGNTRLKWATADAPGDARAMAHSGEKILLPPEVSGDAAWVACVAPESLKVTLLDQLSRRFSRVHCAQVRRQQAGLAIAYPDPRQMGVDRFLSLLACVPVSEPSLVVSVGTALTIDALMPDGQHVGGLIAPSPDLMRSALRGVSSRLPPEGGAVFDFADNTLDALASGCAHAAISLIESRWRALEAQSGTQAQCILHGGGASALHGFLPRAILQTNLVLRGLGVWRKSASTPRMSA